MGSVDMVGEMTLVCYRGLSHVCMCSPECRMCVKVLLIQHRTE